MDCASIARTYGLFKDLWAYNILYIEGIMEIVVINKIYYTFKGAMDSLLYTVHNFEIILSAFYKKMRFQLFLFQNFMLNSVLITISVTVKFTSIFF